MPYQHTSVLSISCVLVNSLALPKLLIIYSSVCAANPAIRRIETYALGVLSELISPWQSRAVLQALTPWSQFKVLINGCWREQKTLSRSVCVWLIDLIGIHKITPIDASLQSQFQKISGQASTIHHYPPGPPSINLNRLTGGV